MHLNNKRYTIFKHGYNGLNTPQRLIALLYFYVDKTFQNRTIFRLFRSFLLLNLSFPSAWFASSERTAGPPSSRDHPSASTLSPCCSHCSTRIPCQSHRPAVQSYRKCTQRSRLRPTIRANCSAPSEALYSYTPHLQLRQTFHPLGHLGLWSLTRPPSIAPLGH